MGRYQRFAFLVNGDERALIRALAERLQRSESDAVRLIVREAVRPASHEEASARSASCARGRAPER